MSSSSSALLVVDLQDDFLPGGALPVPEGDAIVDASAAVARFFETVVATQDFHPRRHVSFASSHPGRRPGDVIDVFGVEQRLWPDHCVAGTPGAALAKGFPDAGTTLILRKGTRPEVDSYSAFREEPGADGSRATTGLGAWLHARGIRRVYIAGLARDFCVKATALDAVAEGFEALVVDDLTRAVFPANRAAVDDAFRRGGVGLIDRAALARELRSHVAGSCG